MNKISWYKKDWKDSRWYDDFDIYVKCEWCWMWWVEEVHHILSSFRWKRSHCKDWSDLIWLCRKCHIKAHNGNNIDMRVSLLSIARKCIEHSKFY